ncbi:MAG: hypothetical protein LBV09_00810 [Deferribacteraceae bacterium]|jgi:type IV secretory pathway TrbF-like protein|nr:hypothetical protein [Deferribacteraceae bacterium]
MNGEGADKTTEEFTRELIKALDVYAAPDTKERGGINPFFCSRVWFFLALLGFVINILMVGVVFWQKMRIDYLINKIAGG